MVVNTLSCGPFVYFYKVYFVTSSFLFDTSLSNAHNDFCLHIKRPVLGGSLDRSAEGFRSKATRTSN